MRFASAPARSTLADALNLRDWRIYHALALRPISHARALYAEDASVLDLNASVYALDSTVLINRINLFWGANWSAIPNHFPPRSLERGHDRCPDLVIGCVDTRSARKAIEDSFSRTLSQTYYWLDLGNNAASGQYVLGQPLNARNRRKANRLKTIGELCPEIVDADVGEDPLPSCSAVEALDRQEPFINQTLASSALTMMAQLFRYGKLSHHGAFFNAKTGRMCALPVDPALWSKTRKRTRRIQQAIGSK
jgi:PRTRC genetic system ThiF family protein